jgi:hypothetical protein
MMYIRFKVLVAVNAKITVFRDIAMWTGRKVSMFQRNLLT